MSSPNKITFFSKTQISS